MKKIISLNIGVVVIGIFISTAVLAQEELINEPRSLDIQARMKLMSMGGIKKPLNQASEVVLRGLSLLRRLAATAPAQSKTITEAASAITTGPVTGPVPAPIMMSKQQNAIKVAVQDLAGRLRISETEIKVMSSGIYPPNGTYTINLMRLAKPIGISTTPQAITPQPFGTYTYTVRWYITSAREKLLLVDRVKYFDGSYDIYTYTTSGGVFSKTVQWIDQYDKAGKLKARIVYKGDSKIDYIIHYNTADFALNRFDIKYIDIYRNPDVIIASGASAFKVERFLSKDNSVWYGIPEDAPLYVFYYEGALGLERLTRGEFRNGVYITYKDDLAQEAFDGNRPTPLSLFKFVYDRDANGNIISTRVIYRDGSMVKYEALLDPVDIVAPYIKDMERIDHLAHILGFDLAVYPSPLDINGDGVIDEADINEVEAGYDLATKWDAYLSAETRAALDMDHDGAIGDADTFIAEGLIKSTVELIDRFNPVKFVLTAWESQGDGLYSTFRLFGSGTSLNIIEIKVDSITGEARIYETTTYAFDENGNLLQLDTSQYDENNRMTHRLLESFYTDEAGTSYRFDSEDVTFTYNPDGTLQSTDIVYNSYDSSGNITQTRYETTTYAYDENGNITQTRYETATLYDENGNLLLRDTYQYDENDRMTHRLLESFYTDEAGTSYRFDSEDGTFTYNPDGTWQYTGIVHNWYDSSGNITQTSHETTTYVYDENANLLQRDIRQYDDNNCMTDRFLEYVFVSPIDRIITHSGIDGTEGVINEGGETIIADDPVSSKEPKTFEGTLEADGASFYMEGQYTLKDADGNLVCLVSDPEKKLPEDLLGKWIKITGPARSTVEGKAIIITSVDSYELPVSIEEPQPNQDAAEEVGQRITVQQTAATQGQTTDGYVFTGQMSEQSSTLELLEK